MGAKRVLLAASGRGTWKDADFVRLKDLSHWERDKELPKESTLGLASTHNWRRPSRSPTPLAVHGLSLSGSTTANMVLNAPTKGDCFGATPLLRGMWAEWSADWTRLVAESPGRSIAVSAFPLAVVGGLQLNLGPPSRRVARVSKASHG